MAAGGGDAAGAASAMRKVAFPSASRRTTAGQADKSGAGAGGSIPAGGMANGSTAIWTAAQQGCIMPAPVQPLCMPRQQAAPGHASSVAGTAKSSPTNASHANVRRTFTILIQVPGPHFLGQYAAAVRGPYVHRR